MEELQDIASQLVALIDDLHLEIDGVAVPNLFSYRAKSPGFSIEIAEPGSTFERSYGAPFTGLLDPMVADGYAVLVTPLPPGVHVIRWGGHVGPPVNRGSDATVSVTVVPIPAARRVQELIDTVTAGLPRQYPLIKRLEAAKASFESDRNVLSWNFKTLTVLLWLLFQFRVISSCRRCYRIWNAIR